MIKSSSYRQGIEEGFVKEAIVGGALMSGGRALLSQLAKHGITGQAVKQKAMGLGGKALSEAKIVAKEEVKSPWNLAFLPGLISGDMSVGEYAGGVAGMRAFRKLVKPHYYKATKTPVAYDIESRAAHGIPRETARRLGLNPLSSESRAVWKQSKGLKDVASRAREQWTLKNLGGAAKSYGVGTGGLALETIGGWEVGGAVGRKILPAKGKDRSSTVPEYVPSYVTQMEYKPKNLPA